MELTASTELVLGSIRFEADEENPRFLRFHDAVLARAETNSNRDALDEEGIQELAATIAGTPVDLEHDPKKNVGFYTAGKAEDGALRVDGVLWLDRCDALGVNPAEIENGTYKLSIEAEANTASCSICNTTHTSIASYCKHLRNKLLYKATRFLKGLKAVGGALTKTPAGSSTGFSGLYFVASHQLEDELEVEGAITKREDVSPADKKRAEKEYGDVEYADEKNKKYPLDEKHIHQALSYWGNPDNRAKYSPEEQKTITNKIRRAAKRLGVEVSDDKKSKSESSLKEPIMAEKEKEETPEEEKKESPEKEAEETKNEAEACDMPDGKAPELKADDYAAMSKKVADMAAELETAKVDLKAEQDAKAAVQEKYNELEARVKDAEAALTDAQSTIKAHRTNDLKSKLVGSVMEEDEFTKRVEELLGLPDAALELLARVNVKRESTDAKKPEDNRLAAAEVTPDNGKINIIL